MRIRRALEITLGVVALLLLWQIGVTWRRPLPPPLLPSVATPGKTPQAPLPVRATPDSLTPQVQLIAAKNLFDPNRGRVEVTPTQEEGPKEVPPPSHLKLVGVVVARGRTEAMFADASQGGKAVRVKQGDTLGAYQLVSVTPTAVKLGLGAGGGEVTLALAILESAQAAQAPNLIPSEDPQADAALGRARAIPSREDYQVPVPNPDEDIASQEEAQALRENIQQMQQRLRQIRRRAAIEEARSRGETIEEDEGEGEEE